MKSTIQIAKAELRTLFYSPIAWFLLIIFMIQCAIVYMGRLENAARIQELSGVGHSGMGYITEIIFLARGGLFESIIVNLYLYIPLLTMSLISRETSSGTIKLLYSSPITISEIVLGKFLSMMVYSLALIFVISIFLVSGIYHVHNPDFGMLLSAVLGLYLLLCAYSAIGLFMSCLSTYQVVAAIATFVMVGILSNIGTLWQDIKFVRELTYFLSIDGRTQNMLKGLISSKDVIYFLVIIYLFLALSIYKLKAGAQSKPAKVKVLRYIAVISSGLLIGYISSIPNFIGYYDATANKLRTLTPNTQKILKEMGEEPLEIIAYNNLLGKYWFLGAPTSYKDNQARWESYMRFKSDIHLKTVLYYDDPLDRANFMKSYPGKSITQVAEQYAKSMKQKLGDFYNPEQMRKIIDLRPELNRYVMQLKWKGRSTFLRTFDDQSLWPSETEVSAALKRLQLAKMPRISFLSGHLERDVNKIGDKDYKSLTNLSTFRLSLINQGFDVDSIILNGSDIPSDIMTLVIADPKVALTTSDVAALDKYIAGGGNLLIAGEPGRQDILNPLLKKLGIQMTDGIIVEASKEFSPDLVKATISNFAGTFYRYVQKSIEINRKVTMPSVGGLTYADSGDFKIRPLLTSDPKQTWIRKNKLNTELYNKASLITPPVKGVKADPTAKTNSDLLGIVTFSATEGDIMGPATTAVALTRQIKGKEQRIVIAGDADFLSSVELQRYNIEAANFVFGIGVFSWLSYQEFPVDTSRPDSKDTRVNVTLTQVDTLRIIYVWVMPALVAFASIVLLLRRKRK